MKEVKNIIKELEKSGVLYRAIEDRLLTGELVEGIVQSIMIEDKDSFIPEDINYSIRSKVLLSNLKLTRESNSDFLIDEKYFEQNSLYLPVGARVTNLTLTRKKEEYFGLKYLDLKMSIEFSKNSPIVASLISIVDRFEESTRGNSKGVSIAFGLELPELVAKSNLITKLNIRKAIETCMYDQKFKELDIELHKEQSELYVFYRMYPDLELFVPCRRNHLGRLIDSGQRSVLTPSDIPNYSQGIHKALHLKVERIK